MEKNNHSRTAKNPVIGTPNTEAANDAVSQSVAKFAATPKVSKKSKVSSTGGSDNSEETRKKRTYTKRKPAVKSTDIKDKTIVKKQAQSKDKHTSTANTAESQTKISTSKKSIQKRTRKQTAKPASTKTVPAAGGVTTESQHTTQTTAPVEPTATSTVSSSTKKQVAEPKPKAQKSSAKTDATESPTRTKSQPKKTEVSADSETRPDKTVHKRSSTNKTRRRPKRTKKKAVAAKATVPPKRANDEEHIIGFQGIHYKPYTLSSKDLFMSIPQQDHFLDILTRAKEKLLAEESGRQSQFFQENDASNLPDPLDQGAHEGVFHTQLRTRDRESQLVRKINRAIECIRTGAYGYCEACGCEIPIRRLEARPIVTKCIDCKERDELRERQLGH